MPTLQKLYLARSLYRLTNFALKIAGKDTQQVDCRRAGVNWRLDVKEGIDLSIYCFGAFEPSTAKFLRQFLRPGMTVFDIGANVGAHTLPIANRVGPAGHVYAVEPTDWAMTRLRANVELNPDLLHRITMLQAIISEPDSVAPREFAASWDLTTYYDGDPVHGGQSKSAFGAQVVGVDELVRRYHLERLDLIKLDVDGMEVSVLRSGLQTFAKFAPHIVLELCPYILERHGESLARLVAVLESAGYRLFDVSRHVQLSGGASAIQRRIPRNGAINALAVHERFLGSARPDVLRRDATLPSAPRP